MKESCIGLKPVGSLELFGWRPTDDANSADQKPIAIMLEYGKIDTLSNSFVPVGQVTNWIVPLGV